MRRPDLARVRPDLVRKRRRPKMRPRAVRKIFRDVEYLAEVVADTVGKLHATGRADLAQPLEDALDKLAGGRR